MKPVICFGEIMARFCPPGHLRLRQAMPGQLEVTFAGAEANVAASIAVLGGSAEFVSAMPDNPLSEACLANLRSAGVGVGRVVLRPHGRLGLFFLEAGANQRGGSIVYDRDRSTFALTGPEGYDWNQLLAEAGWLHISGIAAGASAESAQATAAVVKAAQTLGVPISCDLNFRRKLWQWQPGTSATDLARRTMAPILAQVDLLIANPFDLADILEAKWSAPDSDDLEARLEAHAQLAKAAVKQFLKLRWIALTMRQQLSASSNEWSAMLLRTEDDLVVAAPLISGKISAHRIETMVDRVGTGDAFAGALIFALQTKDLTDPAEAISFATAAGCLAHSIAGDFNYCTRAEVESLSRGNSAGHLSR